ncbi:MAG: hypothetical protein R3F24_10935 [Gammaproteobacteria bacterium]
MRKVTGQLTGGKVVDVNPQRFLFIRLEGLGEQRREFFPRHVDLAGSQQLRQHPALVLQILIEHITEFVVGCAVRRHEAGDGGGNRRHRE